MMTIRFHCDYRRSEKTTKDCYECSKQGKCELFRDMSAEEEDRTKDEESESDSGALSLNIN
jgi:hypothetical protein